MVANHFLTLIRRVIFIHQGPVSCRSVPSPTPPTLLVRYRDRVDWLAGRVEEHPEDRTGGAGAVAEAPDRDLGQFARERLRPTSRVHRALFRTVACFAPARLDSRRADQSELRVRGELRAAPHVGSVVEVTSIVIVVGIHAFDTSLSLTICLVIVLLLHYI